MTAGGIRHRAVTRDRRDARLTVRIDADLLASLDRLVHVVDGRGVTLAQDNYLPQRRFNRARTVRSLIATAVDAILEAGVDAETMQTTLDGIVMHGLHRHD